MESIIFRRGTRKGCGYMRGGRPLNKQISNLEKSIQYLTTRKELPEYRRQKATNIAQIEKQTKELQLLKQYKQASNNARVRKEEANKKSGLVAAFTNAVASVVNPNNKTTSVPLPVTRMNIQSSTPLSITGPIKANIKQLNNQKQPVLEIITMPNSKSNIKKLANTARQLANQLQSIANPSMAAPAAGGKRRTKRRTYRK